MSAMAWTLYHERDSTQNSGISLSLYVRLMVFAIIGAVGIGLSAAAVPRLGHNSLPDSFNLTIVLREALSYHQVLKLT
ncbi:hypothetical protein DXG01_001808 [Tephrocybe rancida]|nr:hypothetical protein DXG01_001808 [Tephrocybe rancida]